MAPGPDSFRSVGIRRPVLSGAANETRFGTFVAVASKRVTLGIIGYALASCG